MIAVLALSLQEPLGFDKTEAAVPMRDGVRLNTHVFTPKARGDPLPIVYLRTPYGIADRPKGQFAGYLKELAADGYIFVFQDIRGRFQSEGRFAMMRAPRGRNDAQAIDESTDAYDTIEWLLKNVPGHNGRVGMLGISYDGWLTVMACHDPHPALAAASPQAPPADMFLGDDFHHNGAFRLSYGFEYVAMMESSKTVQLFRFDRYDTFEWYLALGPLGRADEKYFHGQMPTWNDFAAHPNYDAFWKAQACALFLGECRVPTLTVAGWWDQEDFYGPLQVYESWKKNDPKHLNRLVVGPWNHGGWARGDGSRLGRVEFGSPTAKEFRERLQARWFAHWLKRKGGWDEAPAVTFRTGANKWMSYGEWPPKTSAARSLYFRAGGRLSFDRPEENEGIDSYVSDPAKPVPYRPRPIDATYQGPGWPTWLVEDQRFCHLRPDVLSWETQPLERDLTVAGAVSARLWASTTGTDSDWIVKLIDVYPEDHATLKGFQLMVAGEVLRGRFRKSFEKPEPIVPGEPEEYVVDLRATDHTFLKGHKIMVQVQSTWFPVIDRNPQTFTANIFEAKESDYRPATQTVFRSRSRPSAVVLSVAEP